MRPPATRRSVFQYCTENGISNPFSKTKNAAGKDWFYSFMGRHPQLGERRPQHLNETRARKLNRFIVNDHFPKLKEVMTTMGVMQEPGRIFNAHEKGIRTCQQDSRKVVAKRGVRRVHICAPEHGESVTVMHASVRLGILFLQ